MTQSVTKEIFPLKKWLITLGTLAASVVVLVLTTILDKTTDHFYDPSILDGLPETIATALQDFGSWLLSPLSVPRWVMLLILLGLVMAPLLLLLFRASRSLAQVQAQLAELQNPPIPDLSKDQLTVLDIISFLEEERARSDRYTISNTTKLSLLVAGAALDVLEQHKLIRNIAGQFELTKAGRAYLVNPAVKCDYAKV